MKNNSPHECIIYNSVIICAVLRTYDLRTYLHVIYKKPYTYITLFKVCFGPSENIHPRKPHCLSAPRIREHLYIKRTRIKKYICKNIMLRVCIYIYIIYAYGVYAQIYSAAKQLRYFAYSFTCPFLCAYLRTLQMYAFSLKIESNFTIPKKRITKKKSVWHAAIYLFIYVIYILLLWTLK